MRTNRTFRNRGTQAEENRLDDPELNLLLQWPSRLEVFAENLADRLRGRVVPEVQTTSVPDFGFWQDIDLAAPFPQRGMRDSVFAHAALLGLLYAVSIWPHSALHLADTRNYREVSGYSISEYLPELHGKPVHRKQAGKADPVQAKQEIRSLPDSPDNFRQTIVTPPKVRLRSDVSLPNLVAYGPVPAAPAIESTARKATLQLPAMMPAIVAPAAETGALRTRSKLPSMLPVVVEPTPEIAESKSRLTLPAFQPEVVQPAPEAGSVHGNGANLARLLPSGAGTVPPAPQVGEAQHASGQLMALSLHPAEVKAPVQVPEGNHRGAFAASPSGRADASGTPGDNAASGNGGVPGTNARVNAPAGIDVSAAPGKASAMASPSATRATEPSADVRTRLLAAMHAPTASIPPRQPLAHEATGERTELEKRIFAGRRSYTLSVNMPNLNTATGSWIIHFVERTPGLIAAPIAAPEVVSKSDPAYPGELIRDGVQGSVVLTAVIRADGSVGNIAVAKSLDPKLDQNAVQALSRWLFRPALKDGRAIDLEAVITVPFRSKATTF